MSVLRIVSQSELGLLLKQIQSAEVCLAVVVIWATALHYSTISLFLCLCLSHSVCLSDSLCLSVCLSDSLSLHSLQRRALKLILLKQSPLEKDDYNKLNVLPLHTRLKYNKGIFMKKIMVGNAPPSLSRLFPINPTRDQIKINIPTPRIDLFKTSLTFSGASLWNSLPFSLKKYNQANYSKNATYLISLLYHD